MNISENIKFIRTHFNLTQSELGVIAGVSDKAVSTWEKGINSPRMGVIEKIATSLNISKSCIIEENGFKLLSISLKLSEDEEILINNYRKLNIEGQTKVFGYAEDIADNDKYKKFNSSVPEQNTS